MIIKAKQEYWEWISHALNDVNHPLKERFESSDPVKVLVSRDELNLIIEAVTECRTEWERLLEGQDSGEDHYDPTEEDALQNDLVILDETIDFLNNLKSMGGE